MKLLNPSGDMVVTSSFSTECATGETHHELKRLRPVVNAVVGSILIAIHKIFNVHEARLCLSVSVNTLDMTL